MYYQLIKQKKYDKLTDILLLLVLFSPFVVLILLLPSDWAGWAIVGLTYIIPLYFKIFRSNKNLLLVTLFVVTIHHAIAFINSFISPTFGAEKDAVAFHRESSMIALYNQGFDFSLGSIFYENFLALIYRTFGVSKFLGSELSVLAFLISLVVILKISQLLQKETKYLVPISLLYGLLPTVFLFTSVTLRESFQMMFFNLTVYYGLKFTQDKKIRDFMILLFSLILMGALHNGLLVAAPFILLIIIMFSLDGKKRRFTIPLKAIMLAIALIIVLGGFFILTKAGFSTKASDALFSGEILEYTGDYSKEEYAGGSHFGVNLDTSTIFSTIKTLPLVFIGYMFAPFPWQIRGVLDIYAFFESLLRFLLFFFAWSGIKKSHGIVKKKYKMVFMLFILVELIWATGTQNWGTAMRHHLIGYGILLVMGIDGLLKKR